MPTGRPYYDENPMRYIAPLYADAVSYQKGLSPRIKEQWDMFLAFDEYIEDRRGKNRSALSFPLIFAHIEARVATLLEILNASENIIRFEPIEPTDSMAQFAAERLESAFNNIRADLEWDAKWCEMFQANEIFDYNWVSLEAETIPIRPETGVIVTPDLFGTDKTYPSFNLYAPGRVLVDGQYEKEEQIPAKFKTTWMSYHQIRERYPDRVGTWLCEHEQSRAEVEGDGLFRASDWENRGGGSAMSTMFDDRPGKSSSSGSEKGFLVVEGHVKAMFSDGSCRPRIITFMPKVKIGQGGESSPYGYVLDEMAKPFNDIEDLVFVTRGRPLPYTIKGKGTSDLLVPFQRDFSEQLSAERDFDRLYQAPPIAMRSQMYIGKEKPRMDAYEIWNFKDTAETKNIPVSHFFSPISVPTPNRQWAMATNQKIQNLMDLISAAVEATTGGVDVNPNKTATAFSGRARASARRMMIPFKEQARTIIRITRAMLAMMNEAPGEFLYPHIRARTNQTGPASLLPSDLMAAVHVRVPSLAQYANRELQKVMWRMVAEGVGQFPLTANSPSAQMMLIENMLRSMEIGEEKVQQFKANIASDLQLANQMAQSYTAIQMMQMHKSEPGPQPGPTAGGMGQSGGMNRMGPNQVAHVANITTQGVG